MNLQTIKLYSDTGITFNRRYKTDMRDFCSVSHTFENHQVGHTANTNALQDFEVKLAIPISEVWEVDMIELHYDDFTLIGMVTGVIYTNPNLTRIPFILDAWHTALANGYVDGVEGWLSQTHLEYSASDPHLINLLGEPYVSSDTMVEFPALQDQLNRMVHTIEATEAGNRNLVWIVEVSSRVALDPRITGGHLNPISGWTGLTGFLTGTTLTVSADGTLAENLFPNFGLSARRLGGETVAGVMFPFAAQQQAQMFIDSILRSGLARPLDIPEGTFTNQATFMNQISSVFTSEDGTTQRHFLQYNASDILGVYRIPAGLVSEDVVEQSFTVDAFHNDNVLNTLTSTNLPTSNSKLYRFPYTYYKFRTNVGGEFNIIPQSHFHNLGTDTENPQSMEVQFMFTGGNQPRLLMRIAMVREISNFTRAFEDWVTVRVYPQLTVSIDGQISTDHQWGMETMLQLRNAENSVRHGQNQRMAVAGTVGGVSGMWAGAKAGAKIGASLGAKGAIIGAAIGGFIGMFGGMATSSMQTELASTQAIIDVGNAQAQGSANVFSSPPNVISGVTGLVAATQPAFSAWRCGATLMELQAMYTQLEDVGEICNIFCNIHDDEIAPNVNLDNGRPTQFFRFTSISQVDAPFHFKQDIANLFMSGVYIMNTHKGV